jgi:hypothetical protein
MASMDMARGGRLTAVIAALVVVSAAGIGGRQAPPEGGNEGKPLRLLATFDSKDSQDSARSAMLDALPGVKWTKAVMPQDAGLLKPGLEKDYDALLMFDLYRRTPAERAALAELMGRRMGFVLLNLPNESWKGVTHMVGGTVDGRAAAAPTTFRVTVTDVAHPITRGVTDFALADRLTTSVARTPDTRIVLRVADPPSGDDGALAWTLMYGEPYALTRILVMRGGRERTAWNDPNWRRVLGQGIHWTACAVRGRFC